MPYRIEAAAMCPPVEFVIIDYNSRDDLWGYIQSLSLPKGVTLAFRRYTGRKYWHTAHAYNLAILASHGEYFSLMGADTFPKGMFFDYVRERAKENYVWLEPTRLKGAITCFKPEFIACGGYDERFEFYGPEDRELANRLTLRGGKKGTIPSGLMGEFHTPDNLKVANSRIMEDKHTLSRMMRVYYEQSKRDRTVVANTDVEWGSWGVHYD